jgi:hypothetical protein
VGQRQVVIIEPLQLFTASIGIAALADWLAAPASTTAIDEMVRGPDFALTFSAFFTTHENGLGLLG